MEVYLTMDGKERLMSSFLREIPCGKNKKKKNVRNKTKKTLSHLFGGLVEGLFGQDCAILGILMILAFIFQILANW